MDAPWREDSVLPSVMDWETRFEKLDPIVSRHALPSLNWLTCNSN